MITSTDMNESAIDIFMLSVCQSF